MTNSEGGFIPSPRKVKEKTEDFCLTERAIELIIIDLGGEKALKELFLKEQD